MPKQARSEGSRGPKASRPDIPKDYGIAKGNKGLLEWGVVDEWLQQAITYWLATASLTGKPHAVPVWGLWVDGVLYFSGSAEARWMRNLAANPQIVAHIESGSSVVMLEGSVEPVTTPEPAVFEQMVAQSQAKYKYPPESVGEGTYLLRPRKVMAWDNNALGQTATRWRFD